MIKNEPKHFFLDVKIEKQNHICDFAFLFKLIYEIPPLNLFASYETIKAFVSKFFYS